jgi:hypothetical protein
MIFSVTKAAMRCLESEILTSGMLRAVVCRFGFSSEWDGLSRTAVFSCGNVTKDVLVNSSNEATIPWELMVDANIGQLLKVGVYGINGDGDLIIPTVYCETVRIQRGTDPSGDHSAEPTPTIWEEMLADNALTREKMVEAVQEISEIGQQATAAKEAAETAQGKAETAQGKAEDAQTAAETAQGKAETAQGKAEDAQTAAETAQGKAETAQGKAEDAQTAAETAAGLAGDAVTAANQAKQQAQAAKTAAETAQGKAETAQGKAEDAQTAAETAQGKAETAEGKAEDAQTAAETAQGKAETAQGKAEDAQAAAEAAQRAAEAAAEVRVTVHDVDNNKYYIVSQRMENGFLIETFTEVQDE